MEKITFEQIPKMFDKIGSLFIEKKDELCEMDAKLGDGDLGLTMSKGFGTLPELLRGESEGAAGDCGKLLMKAGMKMSSLIPSTMGFLMSTGVMEGGKAVKGVAEFGKDELASFLEGFAAGIQKRGKCEAGQRTIYDAIFPAAQAAKAESGNEGATLVSVMEAAFEAAKSGVEATKGMVPVFGKAAVHAAQSKGVADQGAVAGCYLIQGMHDFICQ